MEKELNEISRRCWRTSTSRFESARRMKRCHNASTLCIAMVSLEIIVINLMVYIKSLQLDTDAVTITTVCLSAFVLVLSLLVSQLKYEQREKTYHQCAVELGNLEKQINIFKASNKPVTYEVLMRFHGLYNSIITKSNLNHSTMDHLWARRNDEEQIEKYKDKPIERWFHNRWLEIKWYLLRSDSLYHLITILGLIAIIVILSNTK